MNRYDFTKPGGFPFDQGVMQFIQDCIGTAAKTAAMAGPLAILSGCVVAGGSVGDGVVVINGEILPFTGGVAQPKVIIVETATTVLFQDGAPRVVKYVRNARFGDDGTANYPFASFKRNTAEGVLARLDRLEWLTAPDKVDGGSMRFWNKPADQIPAGWREVLDFAGRFPMGEKAGVVGFEVTNEGGAETHTLTEAELPVVTLSIRETALALDFGSGSTRDSWTGETDGSVTFGGGESHSILNPYRIVKFIEPIPLYIA